MQSRRRFLRNSSLFFGAATGGFACGSFGIQRISAQDRSNTASAWTVDGVDESPISRIAFGSCLHQDKPQRIWDAVLSAQPDLFLFLGDNIYGDTRDITQLREQYTKLAAQPGFQRLKKSSRIFAVWDDHDYGENDAGASYPLKELSRQTFLEFWQEPRTSARWSRNGVYTSRLYGPPGNRVQIIMPDLRYNRTPLTPLDL
jgi:alkaline phosphatase D